MGLGRRKSSGRHVTIEDVRSRPRREAFFATLDCELLDRNWPIATAPSRVQTTAGLSANAGGGVWVATFQPMAVRRALTTFATPRPMPAVAAHSRASGHENRV